MAGERLYLPEELELIPVLRDGEGCVSGYKLLERAPELRIITGGKQLRFLWENRNDIPNDWESISSIVVLDVDVVRVLYFVKGFNAWYHNINGLGVLYGANDRALRPRDGV